MAAPAPPKAAARPKTADSRPTAPPPLQSPAGGARKTGAPKLTRGKQAKAHRTVVYGAGGVGKTELIANMAQLGIGVLFFDLDSETSFVDAARVEVPDYDSLVAWLKDDELTGPFGCLAIDSFSKLEELCTEWVLANVKTEKGHNASSIKSFGFGDGLVHVYEAFVKILALLDKHARNGKHIACTAHECATEVPNPAGEDYLAFMPRLQSPRRTAKIRERVYEWADHVLYVGFDVCVDSDGKGKGGGTRTIHTAQMPTWWAKSRVMSESVPYQQGECDIWRRLFA